MSANFFWWPCMYCGGGRPVNGCAMRYPANKFSHSPGLSRLTASLTPHSSGTVGMSCLSTFFTISSASAAGIAHERTYVGATCVTRTSAPSLSLALMDSGSSRIVESSPVFASYASSRPIAKCGASSGGPRSTNEATRVPRKYSSMRAFFIKSLSAVAISRPGYYSSEPLARDCLGRPGLRFAGVTFTLSSSVPLGFRIGSSSSSRSTSKSTSSSLALPPGEVIIGRGGGVFLG